jgi:hypothetical protein
MLSLCRFKRPFCRKRKLPKGVPFGGLALCETKCFTKTRVPEYYALLCGGLAQGAFRLMFLYSSLNSPNDPVAGVALLVWAFRHGSLSVAEKSHLAGKATTFFFAESFPAKIPNLKLRRKELHL